MADPRKSSTSDQPIVDGLPSLSQVAERIVRQHTERLVPKLLESRVQGIKEELYEEFKQRLSEDEILDLLEERTRRVRYSGVSPSLQDGQLRADIAAGTGSSILGFTPSGSGAVAETVQSALRDLRAYISTDTVPSRFYRADATFNGTVDNGTFLGYNITGFGQITDAAKSSIMVGFEPNYNDGSVRVAEIHLNIAVPGGSYKRPFSAFSYITGANAGLMDANILGDRQVSIFTPLIETTATEVRITAADTTGTRISLIDSDTGGKNWQFYSTGSAAGLGAGNLIFYNATNSRYGLILSALGNVVAGDVAALATDAADGFLYVPTCAGTPTGTPTAYTGKAAIVVNTTNNKLYFYSGGAWRDAGP